jgi:hypothetical protein
MRLIPAFSISLVGAGLLFLGACASSPPPSVEPSPATSASPAIAPAAAPEKPASETSEKTGHGGQGGQVVEVGAYHLELLPIMEGDAVHLDFFLQQGDDHAPIPDAKVVAQVQLPDGTQKTVDFTYADAGKHYTARLEGSPAGEYKVAVLSEIGGEKVNGRFTFSK